MRPYRTGLVRDGGHGYSGGGPAGRRGLGPPVGLLGRTSPEVRLLRMERRAPPPGGTGEAARPYTIATLVLPAESQLARKPDPSQAGQISPILRPCTLGSFPDTRSLLHSGTSTWTSDFHFADTTHIAAGCGAGLRRLGGVGDLHAGCAHGIADHIVAQRLF